MDSVALTPLELLGDNPPQGKTPSPSTARTDRELSERGALIVQNPGGQGPGQSPAQSLKVSERGSPHQGNATKRLMAEMRHYLRDPLSFITFAPMSDDLLHMLGCIEGPLESPYEGGIFYVRVDFVLEYPFRPPKCTFVTKVYHPNISPEGRVCMDILENSWTPAINLPTLLLSIFSLLGDPYFPESFIPEITLGDRAKYEKTAREQTKKWATGEQPSDFEIESAGKERPGLNISWEDYVEDSDLEGLIEQISASE